jgi:hypothetical protein
LQSEIDPGAASRNLERIRILMERAGRYSHLSAAAALAAGALAAGGAVACRLFAVNFNHPAHARTLALVWGAVFLLSAAGSVAFTVAGARRRAEPAWSPLARQVVLAMLPALFVGAAVTGYGLQTGQLDLLPPFWCLAYGTSLMGLGLYAGGRLQLVGALFLLAGAASLLWLKEYGLRVMLASFGGFHVLLGALLAWKPRRSAA